MIGSTISHFPYTAQPAIFAAQTIRFRRKGDKGANSMWPDRRLLDLLKLEHPIIQAPMAGVQDGVLVAEVSEAGGLGSLPCAMYGPDQLRAEVAKIRDRTRRPINLNFFCHTAPQPDAARETAWRERLTPYYKEFGLDPAASVVAAVRAPFDAALCAVVEETKPEVVSFHFGLPDDALLKRVRATGCRIIGSATTVAEARWLEARGVDVVIAQGAEAGGHRGMFLTDDVASQVGTFALVPQIVDAVKIPVVAAGGITDARGVAAAFVLGAAGVQIGTAYMFCPEAKVSAPHRAALKSARDDETALTNVPTGRPARGFLNRIVREVGPLSPLAPQFPLAATALQPLRAKAEGQGSGDFSPLWSGQAAALGREASARDLTRQLSAAARERLTSLGAACAK
jgi:nitronate monooxygenase